MSDVSAKNRQDFLPSHRLETLPPRSEGDVSWPSLKQQVLIAFSSRVGSSFLCSEIERTRTVSHVHEAFNQAPLQRAVEQSRYPTIEQAAIEQIRALQREGWFVAKTGFPGLSVAEHYGLIDHYLDRTHFIFLLRRDVAAQAVSIATSKITGQPSRVDGSPMRDVDDSAYSEPALLRPLDTIVKIVRQLQGYLDATGRPIDLLFYEDFKAGDFTAPNAILDRIGLPRCSDAPEIRRRNVQPVTRSVSVEWADRLRNAPKARPLLDAYAELIARVTKLYG